MKIILHLILPLALVCLFSCERQVARESYTETKLEWKGATAEELRAVIGSIAPSIRRAVIKDGEATLYHSGTVADTQKELDHYAGNRPVELIVSAPAAKDGKLPQAPHQVTQVKINWEIDRAKATALGISLAEISSLLRELELQQEEATATKALQDKTIKIPSGEEVRLDSLVKATATAVNRPILLNP